MTAQAELVLDANAELGEGALWDAAAQRLRWVDIERCEVHCYDPATGEDTNVHVGQMVGTVVVRKRGGLMLALHHGFASFDADSGRLELLADPESDTPETRFNDGKCDPAGRFWAGTMGMQSLAGKPAGGLYCLDTDGSVRKVLSGISCSNGIVWNSNRDTMYYIDTPTARIDAFDYEHGSGKVTNRRAAFATPAAFGHPDGMTIDVDDNLWVAFWGGACVRCIDPRAGKVLHQIDVPALQATSVAFGGADLDVLYITSAGAHLTDEQRAAYPQSGGLFRARPGVRGVEACAYAG